MDKLDTLVKDTINKLSKSKNKHYFSEEKAKEILREGLESELFMIASFGENRIPCILSDVLAEFFFDIDAIMKMDNEFLGELFFKYLSWEQVKQTICKELIKSGDLKEAKRYGSAPDKNCDREVQITYSNLDIRKVIRNSFTVVRGGSSWSLNETDSRAVSCSE